MSTLDKVFGAPERKNGGVEAAAGGKVDVMYFNDLTHQLVTLAMSQVGRGNDAGVRDLLQASRVVLDLDPRR